MRMTAFFEWISCRRSPVGIKKNFHTFDESVFVETATTALVRKAKAENKNMFQKNYEQKHNVFDISHYKILDKYLTTFGIHPYQNDQVSTIIVITIVIGSLSFFGPTWIQFYDAARAKNIDGIIEDLPQIIAGITSIIKLLNIRSNKTRFRNLFESVANGWKILKSKNEMCMLEKFTRQGSKLSSLYRRMLTCYIFLLMPPPIIIWQTMDNWQIFILDTLLTILLIFLTLPLINPVMDIAMPLNETRSRHHIFKVNYLIIDEYEHFYPVYVHLSVCSAFIVLMIITVDSLYINIIHHACGLFAVCGYQVKQATESYSLKKNYANVHESGYDVFKQCVMTHHEALLFHDTLERCCRNLYLIQMGLNILIISVTAVEAVMYLDKPDELIRVVVFLVAQNFHLYVISLPGQVLVDQSLELGDKIYASKWHQIPVNLRKILYTMQIRCCRPCILTAGGLYEMKIESFGATVKACMSYITMFLSLRQ